MTLTIVGLGPGDIDDLSRKAWRTLKNAQTVYLRTTHHGCVPCLPQQPVYHSFDNLYDTIEDFAQVYETIVSRILETAQQGDVVYAVPGDPLVGEATVTRLIEQAKNRNIRVEIVSGISFIEPILALLNIDALDHLQILDGALVAGMHHPPINPDAPALLGQVYSRQVASDVKLTLMNQYPDDFPVVLVHAAGTEKAQIEHLPLYQIDHSEHISYLTSLYIPALGGMSSFEQFQEVIAHLRAPEGCPWDRKQTHLSLREYLLEETHEVLEAIDNEDPVELYKEMGDLLLQIVLHTQIAIDDGDFRMSEVISHVNRKMIHRHPHVWGDVEVSGADEVLANWDMLKKQEHARQGVERESRLDGIPKSLPALLQAFRYGEKAAKPGFDWPDVAPVIAKVREELDEVLNARDDEHRAEEMGDLLFAIVNWCRFLKIEPETSLREANAKFARRFRYIEQQVAQSDRPMTDYTLDELDAIWNQAKANGL